MQGKHTEREREEERGRERKRDKDKLKTYGLASRSDLSAAVKQKDVPLVQ